MKKLLFTLLLAASVFDAPAQNVIPLPLKCSIGNGQFEATRVKIVAHDQLLKQVVPFVEAIFKQDKKSKHTIILALDKSINKAEGYRIVVQPKSIHIVGYDQAGVFYGIQSLAQIAADGAPQCGTIEDSPRYAWRGFMLDESRHFFGKEKVLQLLDMMARYKLNKFHWHLTDSEGWRIEIKKYPKLTSIGARGTWSKPDGNIQFYTQDDVHQIIAHAALRNIEIIPEIDMPGHATAANRAYPQYSGGGVPAHPEFTFNPAKEEVYQYLTDILREVSALFPSQYLHIGGDEVSFGIQAWRADRDVQKLMEREKITTIKGVESYFVRRMADTIEMLGKRLIGWDELLDAKVSAQKTTIMWWRHDKVDVLRESLANNYPTILCPRRPLYFDFIQDEAHKWGRVWAGYCPAVDVYNFPDEDFEKWKLDRDQNIIGIQANLWTERVQNDERLDFMIYPRLAALAESAWSAKDVKNFEDFNRRLEREYDLYDRMGLYYYKVGKPESVGCVQQTNSQ